MADGDVGGAPPPVYKTVVAASLSICLGKVATHPLDTLKAQLQVDTSAARQRSAAAGSDAAAGGLAPTLRRAIARNSVRSLYQGFSIAVVGSLPAGALYMTTYEQLKPQLERRMPGMRFAADFSAGLAAEAISCVIWCPLDVVKERLQVQQQMGGLYRYDGPVDAVRQIVKSREGVLGLYRAYGATLAAFGPQTAINLALYEDIETRAKAWYFNGLGPGTTAPPIPPWLAFACASVSGLTACLATAPLDLAKLRMQVVRAGRHANVAGVGAASAPGAPAAQQPFNYANIGDALWQIARQEGPSALFKGAMVRCLVWVPQTAIFLGTFKALLARV